MYTLITLALIVLGLLVLLPKFKHFTDRYGLAVNFFLTLIATLVGVLLAISIANYEEERKEKQDVVKLLLASVSSVDECLEYTEELIKYHDSNKLTGEASATFHSKNPPPFPEYLDVFLAQNLVSKNLSGDTLSDLNELLINLKRSRTSDVSLFARFLAQTIELLKAEIAFQKQEIDQQQLEQKLEKIKDKLQG